MTDHRLPTLERRLTLSTILGFSTAALPMAALDIAFLVYLAPHFSSHLGVPLTVVGGALFLVRMLDIAVDIGLGIAMDRTRTRMGRYRLWMALGVPVLMASVFMLFMAPVGIGIVRYCVASTPRT